MTKQVPREWTKFKYFDPEDILPKLRVIREKISSTDTPMKIRNLRTNMLSRERESWDTAVFCHLLSLAIGYKILFAREECSDHDCVFTWNDVTSQCYAPVQMKELVPQQTNPDANRQDILSKLSKYSGNDDLIVAVKLNRRERIDFASLITHNLPISELWMFGATTQDQCRWSLFGEVLSGAVHQYEFALPYV